MMWFLIYLCDHNLEKRIHARGSIDNHPIACLKKGRANPYTVVSVNRQQQGGLLLSKGILDSPLFYLVKHRSNRIVFGTAGQIC